MSLVNVQDRFRELLLEIAALNVVEKQSKHDKTIAANAERATRQWRLLGLRTELTVLTQSMKSEAASKTKIISDDDVPKLISVLGEGEG